jgi:ubiquinone/menaquinone biosynthesis C-methylase UbiE
MISERLLSIVRCPACHSALTSDPTDGTTLRCMGCAAEYRQSSEAYLDLRPREQFEEQTKYLDASLHADARHERVSPPLLGSKIRNDMLRRFLNPSPGDRVIDLGCGSGRALLWNRDWDAEAVGVDIAPFFSEEARREVQLLLGDLRRLPFGDGVFNRAYSLDVLEHLSPAALRGMLAEASRILEPGGTLFVYTHVRKNAPVATGVRWINQTARALERLGMVDIRQERLRKSDHLNPLSDIPELERVVSDAGFRIARIIYYTPIVGGFVENILIRVAERVMTRTAARRLRTAKREAGADQHDLAIREVRRIAKERIGRKGPTYLALRTLSAAMKLDLLLFGRIQSGPFFALLEKTTPARASAQP